jgi:hypothetical protein
VPNVTVIQASDVTLFCMWELFLSHPNALCSILRFRWQAQQITVRNNVTALFVTHFRFGPNEEMSWNVMAPDSHLHLYYATLYEDEANLAYTHVYHVIRNSSLFFASLVFPATLNMWRLCHGLRLGALKWIMYNRKFEVGRRWQEVWGS